MLEANFDRQTLIAQRLANLLSRSVRLTDGFTDNFDPTIPSPLAANKILRVKSDLSGFELVDLQTPGALTVSAFIQTLLDDANAAAARATLGAAPTSRAINTGAGLSGGGDLSADRTLSANPSYFKGALFGLTLANNGSDATNDIDIAAGLAVDDGSAAFMVLAAGLTKRLDAAWTVGTNQGGLDTGSIANDVYHVFLIRRPDTGVVDVLFSASATAPTMPTNYTQKRRIGAFIRASGAILAFQQNGDAFLLKGPVLDVTATNPGTSAVLRTLSVPDGVRVEALLNVVLDQDSANAVVYFSSPDQNDAAASGTAAPLSQLSTQTSTGALITSGQLRVWTNTSAQIRTRNSASDAAQILYIATTGWVDNRGRFA